MKGTSSEPLNTEMLRVEDIQGKSFAVSALVNGYCGLQLFSGKLSAPENGSRLCELYLP
jgi:hypothetical protein